MKPRAESYPDRIRRIAAELSQVRNVNGMDQTVAKLRMIAGELEKNLKKALPKTV